MSKILEVKTSEPPSQTSYIHGFSSQEQNRLYRQARTLESTVHHQVDFSECRSVIEVGCGVGAQTKILLERFANIFVQAVDASETQLEQARVHLQDELALGRVAINKEDGARLSFPDAAFDGAFTSWLFEHTSSAPEILREIHRVLKPGGVFYGIEVMNSTFSLSPESPAVMKYWNELNRLQKDFGGDPFVGAKLGNYLLRAGFTDIQVTPFSHLFDQRNAAKFKAKIDYWHGLLLSAAPQLLAAGRVDEQLILDMSRELRSVQNHPQGVFYCTPIKFRVVK